MSKMVFVLEFLEVIWLGIVILMIFLILLFSFLIVWWVINKVSVLFKLFEILIIILGFFRCLIFWIKFCICIWLVISKFFLLFILGRNGVLFKGFLNI